MFAKKMMVALFSSAVLFSALPAEAAFGKLPISSGTKSSSFSSGSSSSSSSSFTRPSSSSSTGGISQGSSLGMSRSNVANSVKNGTYTAPANGTTVAGSNPGGSNYSNSNNYANRNYNSGYNNNYNNGYNQSQGHSTGTLLGAAAVAGAAGYMMGNHNNNPVIVNGQQGYVNGQPAYVNGSNGIVDTGSYNAQPVVVVDQSSGGFGSMIWSLIKIILGLIVLYVLVKLVISLFQKKNEGVAMFNSKTPEDEIRDSKDQFFLNFQKNNRPSGLSYIRSNTTDLIFDALEDSVKQSSETRVVKVKQLDSELVDLKQEGTTYIASVRYYATVSEGEHNEQLVDTPIKELWNFVYTNGGWKLAGIDQL